MGGVLCYSQTAPQELQSRHFVKAIAMLDVLLLEPWLSTWQPTPMVSEF